MPFNKAGRVVLFSAKCEMKAKDIFFAIVVLGIFLALLFIVFNLDYFFPTPTPQQVGIQIPGA